MFSELEEDLFDIEDADGGSQAIVRSLPYWFSWERYALSRLKQFAMAQEPEFEDTLTRAFGFDNQYIVNA